MLSNDWQLNLPEGFCIDMVPVGEKGFAIRPYGMDDTFRGEVMDASTCWMGQPLVEWARARGIEIESLKGVEGDIQHARLFPLLESPQEMEVVLKWMIGDGTQNEGKRLWLEAERLSADELMERASILKLLSKGMGCAGRTTRCWRKTMKRACFINLT